MPALNSSRALADELPIERSREAMACAKSARIDDTAEKQRSTFRKMLNELSNECSMHF